MACGCLFLFCIGIISQLVETRIAALEQAVSDERLARQLLQQEVLFLTEELEQLSAGNGLGFLLDIGMEQPADDSRSARRGDYRRRFSAEGRTDS